MLYDEILTQELISRQILTSKTIFVLLASGLVVGLYIAKKDRQSIFFQCELLIAFLVDLFDNQ